MPQRAIAPDPDEIAKKYGGVADADAIAAKYGGTSEPAPSTPQKEPEWRTKLRPILGEILGQVPGFGVLLQHPEVTNAAMDAMAATKEFATKHPAAAGAIVAGTVAAPFTGGMSIPAALATSAAVAGTGAAVGRGISDVSNLNHPENIPTFGEHVKEIATQGALGAVGEGTGRVVQAGFRVATPVVAKWLYGLGLRPTASMTRNFPTAVKTGVDEGILPRPATIQARLTDIEQQLKDAVSAADAARPKVAGLLPGRTVDTPLGVPATGEGAVASTSSARPSDIRFVQGPPEPVNPRGGGFPGDQVPATQYLSEARPGARPQPGFSGPGVIRQEEGAASSGPVDQWGRTTQAAKPAIRGAVQPPDLANAARQFVMSKANLAANGGRGLREEAIGQLDRLAQQYLKENPAPLSNADTLGLKRAEQTLASASYLTEARGGEVNQIETLWHQGLANAARQRLINSVPSSAEALAKEQGLIGLKTMAEYAADRPEVMARYVKAAAVIGGLVTGHPQEGIATAAIMAAVENPTVSGAAAMVAKYLGKKGATQLTPAVTKALAAAYGGSQP